MFEKKWLRANDGKKTSSHHGPLDVMSLVRRIPNVLQHGVSSYLTMEEQSALASTSQTMRKTMAGAPELKCAKETVRGIKCIRKGARRVIGPVCEEFCRKHFMQ